MLHQKNCVLNRSIFPIIRRFQPFIGYCFLIIILLCQGCSQDASSAKRTKQLRNKEMQRIVFDETSYDMGEIKTGNKGTAVFPFKNSGGKPLKITNIRRCCGTIVKLDKQELAPGESTVLTVEYHAGQMPGVLNRKITLFTDDPENPQTELAITGKVARTLEWTPVRFKLPAEEGINGCPEIKIRSLDGTPFSIKGFMATGDCLTADFDPNLKAEQITLRPVLDIKKLETLPISEGRVKIALDHQDYKTIVLDFDMTPPFEVIPKAIFAAEVQSDKPLIKTLKLQENRKSSNEDLSRRIESLTFENGNRVEIRRFTKVSKGYEIELEMWPFKSTTTESHWSDKLLIKIKDGPQLTVPIFVFLESHKAPVAMDSK